MGFEAWLDRASEVLRRRGKASKRGLMRELGVDDAQFQDVVSELVDVLGVATDDGTVLEWTGPLDAGLPREPAPSEGERRQITVMFCDLVGATHLSATLDPEDLREVVRAYQQLGATAVESVGGHIAQYLGDGLLVYFGWPVAHEDDAVRAVRAGLRMLRGLTELNQRLSQRFSVEVGIRVGIHTGPVVVGEMGGGSTRETLALGQTPNVGARVEGEADKNSVFLSETTESLVRGWFELADRGARELKGVAQPLRLFHAIAEVGARHRFDVAAHRGLTPLVDRHEERRLLEAAWRDSATAGRTILLRGLPGIGKSRLVHYTKNLAGDSGPLVIEAACSPLAQNSALLPMAQAMGSLWGGAPSPLQAIVDAVTRCPSLQPDVDVPLLADLAGIPLSAELGAPVAGWTPQRRRGATLRALCEVLADAAAIQRLLLVVEDVHWADPSTLELLAMIGSRLAGCPALTLMTSRPELRLEWEGMTTIEIANLTPSDARDLVAKTLGGLDVPGEIVVRLAERTDGVPLFVEELTKSVLDTGMVTRDSAGRLHLSDDATHEVPTTLYGCLMARLDALGPVRHVAQTASVIGRDVALDVLVAVTEAEEGELVAKLDVLVDQELMQVRSPGVWQFRHALVQEAAAAALLHKTRRALHLKIAGALLSKFPAVVAASPERVAHHFTEGGNHAEAVTWWQNAGMNAMQRSANVEAIAHFRHALQVLDEWPAGPQKLGMELVLRTLVAIPLTLTRGWANPEVKAEYARAKELCDVVGQAPQLIPTRIGLQTFHIVHGEFVVARQLAAETVEIAESTGDPGLILEAHLDRGAVDIYMGDYLPAIEHLDRARSLYVPELHHSHVYTFGKDPLMFVEVHAALSLVCRGQVDTALEVARRGVEHTEKWPHPFSHLWAQMGLCMVHALRYEPKLAAAAGAQVVAESEAQGFPNWLAQGLTYLGLGTVLDGGVEQGLGQLRQGLAIWKMTGAQLVLPVITTFLARALLHVDRFDEAWASAQEALAMIAQTEERWTEGEVLRVCGEIAAKREGGEAAELWYRRALDSAVSRGALLFELMAATRLAQSLGARGDAEAGAALLRPVLHRMTEGLDTPPVTEARATLEALNI